MGPPWTDSLPSWTHSSPCGKVREGALSFREVFLVLFLACPFCSFPDGGFGVKICSSGQKSAEIGPETRRRIWACEKTTADCADCVDCVDCADCADCADCFPTKLHSLHSCALPPLLPRQRATAAGEFYRHLCESGSKPFCTSPKAKAHVMSSCLKMFFCFRFCNNIFFAFG